jgi:hypothetical protein
VPGLVDHLAAGHHPRQRLTARVGHPVPLQTVEQLLGHQRRRPQGRAGLNHNV